MDHINAWLILLLMMSRASATSFNQPRFCPSATWNTTGMTFANSSFVGNYPYGIFINTNNTVYVSEEVNLIQIWFEGNHIPTTINTTLYGSMFLYSPFVTITEDIYIGISNGVKKLSLNTTNNAPTLFTSGACFDIFIDSNNSLYCSSYSSIIKRSLNSSDYQTTIIAGGICPGFFSDKLNSPSGIFVDQNFNLYVADSGNQRIQMFPYGQMNATTVAGFGAPETIALRYPTDIVFDGDGFLFIVDSQNQRIIGSDYFGFRCIVGCSGYGSSSDRLAYPQNMAFDSYGNIFVVDSSNSRIQKFFLMGNSCHVTNVSQQTSMPPVNTGASVINTTTAPRSVSSTFQQQTVSYNRPKFCPLTTWNPNGITFAYQVMTTWNLFIDTNDTVYTAGSFSNSIQIWFKGNSSLMKTIYGINNLNSYSLFVSSSGDIYLDNGYGQGRVDKWTINGTNSTAAMYVTQSCYGLFVDINNTLYCSVSNLNQVVAKSLNDASDAMRIVAGSGCAGFGPNLLSYPMGIFVDIDFNLYVADSNNQRIQMFQPGQSNAVTLVGNGAPRTITLLYPSAVILDADGYLFIVDRDNHRIIGSGPTGFRCVVGCSGTGGSASNQLYYPQAVAFDSYGNIFVADSFNNRIQKFTLTAHSCVISYNQPTLCLSATWNSTGITFANESTVGTLPSNIFIDVTDTVYVSTQGLNLVQIWSQNSMIPTRNLSGNCNGICGLFITVNGDIYVDSTSIGRVLRWALNTTNSVTVMSASSTCYDLFVDINNTLYCSIYSQHNVMKNFLGSNNSYTIAIAAGTSSAGPASNQLNYPQGIFVNINFDLYVADCGNNRIQLFHSGQLNGMTVAGNSSSRPITLNCPTDVILDGNNYLFIVDSYNHRIIGSGPDGFRCVVGCSGTSGSAPEQLYYPQSLAFDSFGNLFVVDSNNSRIQKFLSNNNTCNVTTTTSTVQTTMELLEEQSSTSTIVRNQSCFPPFLTLIPSTSSLSSPLQFRRNQDFFISSYLQLNCNTSLATIIQWTIHNCTSVCSSPIHIGQTITTTSSELYIPAKTLTYGIYQFTLTVSMVATPQPSSSASAFLSITASDMTANLVQYGTSMITRGYQQDLHLDPGSFSVDPDATIFNASKWNYNYYCRIYSVYDFPNINGLLLTIDDPTIDPHNPSCLSNRTGNGTDWQYDGVSSSIKSSLTILANSLKSNQTYQFMVLMTYRQNSSRQATAYLLVQVEDTQPQLIAVACVISTLCVPNMQYQFVNPTTQVALFSLCIGTCPSITNITWNVYSGVMNSSSTIVQWTPFNQINHYQNIWFFGSNTSNFTSTDDLFLSYPSTEYWRFEVVYSFSTVTSSSALNFVINQPPQNGSCSISPLNGTTSTLFTITCSSWQDEDGIKDYSFYSWTSDSSDRMMLAFSFVSTIEVRLPSRTNNQSLVYLVGFVRDTFDCVTEFNLSSVVVVSDSTEITNLVNNLQSSSSAITNNPLVQMLASGNQNTVGQIITSLSQAFNKINDQSVNNAVANGIPASSIIVSSLDDQTQSSTSSTSMNVSALAEYNKQLNIYANVRDYLVQYTTNLVISTSNSIILQASSLVQLSQATNQLTRTTSMLVSNKCFQLAVALYSIAGTIPYEDVQTAATLIAQCANNVLNSINGPLQERTIVLDLDSSRANAFPQDYDTDLESPWSNLNLFADGNDFSWNQIQIGRNTYYQKQMANQISVQTTKTLSMLTSALNIHLNIDQSVQMNTSSVFMSLATVSIQSLSNKYIEQSANAHIQMPSTFQFNSTDNTSVSLRSMVQPLASLGNSQSRSNTNLSRSISLSLLDHSGNEIVVQTNLSHPIVLIIPRDPNFVIPPMTLQNVTASSTTPHNQLFNLHFIDIASSLPLSVHIEIHSLNSTLGYLFIYKFDSSPTLNSSINNTDGWTLFCPSNLTNESTFTYFIDNQKTLNHQSVIFGVRELNTTEISKYCSYPSPTSPPITNQHFNFTSNYELRTYTSGCYYLDANNNWQSDGLIVGPSTDHYATECYSTHLTTFAGGFLVLPAPINWNYVFANADFNRNKTVYITLICVCILYVLLMIYARRKDKKDVEKLGVTALPDNHQSDQYFYQILVFTGHRRDAGTKSKVHFIVAGEEDETQVRTFADPHRSILQRGGIDAFIITVPKSLGILNYIHIWHDNSGHGASASWFLKYIIVRDLQTMEKSYFICQNWFAVEKGDGAIERVLPVAGEYQKREFSYLLSKQAYHSMSEGHLWFSIFSRPPSNKFTCVQRCTCCFVLLLMSMLLNILYYDQAADAKANATNSIAIGPLYITPQQIGIGVIVDILSLLPSILLIQLFRRVKPRHPHQHVSPLRRAIYQIKQQPIPETKFESTKKKKSSSLTFPWWCLFVAYGLSLILAAISIFLIIARGIEFGDSKTQKWLTSLLSGFFSSLFLIQPIKVIGLAIIFACFIRNPDKDKEAAEFIDEDHPEFDDADEEFVHSNQSPFSYRSHHRAHRLHRTEVVWARDRRLKEIQLWSIIREISSYLIFLSLLYFITYSNNNDQSFYQVQHLRQFFLNTRHSDNDYTKISTIDKYWSWMERSFVSNVRAQQWYNGDPPRNLSGFVNDKANRLIGWALMRQLRVQTNSCHIQNSVDNLFRHCDGDYSFSNEEKQSFVPGWMNQTTSTSNSSIDQSFVYQSGEELNTNYYVGNQQLYGSGGYVYEFRGRLSDLQNNLSTLHQLQWIDSQTRAVIIQFSLYNPNSQLFTSATLLAEFLSTGGIITQSHFEPISFLVFRSVPQLVCLIIYMLFIIYLMIGEVQSFLKLKLNYFCQFWSLIDVGIIVCSWTSLVIYICRYRQSIEIGDLLKETSGSVYINLQFSAYVNNIYGYLLGFCCFFSTVKFVHLCRFSSRVCLFLRALQHASRDLISFVMMFLIAFMAFVILFYLLFVSKLSSCSSLGETGEMLFQMLLMQFDAYELSGADAFLGPFCLSLFVFVIVFVFMSVFLVIINQSFRRVRVEAKTKGDDEMLSYMLYKFQRWIGIGRSAEWDRMIERDEEMRSQYVDPIEHFPDKIDELFDALNRVYMDQPVLTLKNVSTTQQNIENNVNR